MIGDQFFCENTNRTFVFGSTRVLLIEGDYDVSEEDPLVGSEYECEGLVIDVRPTEKYIMQVEWDNGQVNDYRPDDLSIVGHIDIMAEDNPNKSFRFKKREDDLAKRGAELAEREAEFEKEQAELIKHDDVRHTKARTDLSGLKQVIAATKAGPTLAKKALMDSDHDVELAIEITRLRQARRVQYGEQNDMLPVGVKEVMKRTGMGVLEATDALHDHAGDTDAAITYHHLHNPVSMATSLNLDRPAKKENPITKSIKGLGNKWFNNSHVTCTELLPGEVIPDEEENIAEEEAAVIAAKFKSLEEKTAATGMPPRLRGSPNYTSAGGSDSKGTWSKMKKFKIK